MLLIQLIAHVFKKIIKKFALDTVFWKKMNKKKINEIKFFYKNNVFESSFYVSNKICFKKREFVSASKITYSYNKNFWNFIALNQTCNKFNSFKIWQKIILEVSLLILQAI